MAFCEHCLKEIEEGTLCEECAACADDAAPSETEVKAVVSHSASGAPQFSPQFSPVAAPPVVETPRFEMPLTASQLPADLRPLGAWGFLAWGLLFAVPFVGFVAALVCACGATSRMCVKNYARGVLLSWLLAAVLIAVAAGLIWCFWAPLQQSIGGWMLPWCLYE